MLHNALSRFAQLDNETGLSYSPVETMIYNKTLDVAYIYYTDRTGPYSNR